MRRILAFFLFGLVATCSTSIVSASGYAPEVGRRHDDFLLPRIDNRQASSLAEYRGQKVILIQFASW